ncbi:adenylate kinase [Aurantivibrio infirmus]
MNIIIFGPNGSGKGTQSDLIKDIYSLAHIESGDIFREHLGQGTELGKKASEFMEKGELVPDEITIPMVLETLGNIKNQGWLLDGFPRNVSQARSLNQSLIESGSELNFIIEIELERPIAKNRIMGRRICTEHSHHPNNIYIESIQPANNLCRVCGASLKTRADDQDEEAIDKRHDIYYDNVTGTLAAANYFQQNSSAQYIKIDGSSSIENVKNELLSKLGK